MKQYIFSALCLVSGAFCLSSCNDDKEARPYTPDYEIVPEYTKTQIHGKLMRHLMNIC